MANESMSTIMLRLLVDNKAFKEGLVNTLQLVQITSQQIKDLTAFKIPAPDIKALDLALEAGEARVRDFMGIAAEIVENPPVIPPEVPESHDVYTEKLGEGEQALRQFFREQRLQDRVMSEGRQSVLALTSALGFLSIGNTDTTGTTKQLQEGMLAGIATSNGLEFALFGLGQVGGKLPGTLGAIATSAAGLAGPISIAVGVGAAMLTFLDNANAKSKKLAEEGMQAYLGRIKEAGGGNVEFLEEIERSLESQTESLEKLKKVSETTTFGGLDPGRAQTTIDLLRQQSQAVGDVSAQVARASVVQNLNEQDEKHRKIIEELRDEIQKQQVLNDAIRRANDAIKANGDEYRRTKVEVDELTKAIETQNLTEEQRRALIDEREQKQENIRKQTLSTFELAKEEFGLLQQRHALGEATTQQLVAQIDKALQGNLTEKQQMELQTQRHTLLLAAADEEIAVQQTLRELGRATTDDVVRALEAKRAKVTTTKEQLEIERQITEEYSKQAQARKQEVAAAEAALDKLQAFSKEAGLNAIQNRFEKAAETEARRHEQRLTDIEKEFTIAVDNGAEINAARQLADEAIASETALHTTNNANLEKSKQEELNGFRMFLLGSSSEAQLARINQAYDLERQRVEQLFTDEDQRNAALAELERRRTEDVEAFKLRLQLDSVDRLAAALQQAANVFGDDLLGKLAQALQIAIQIQRALVAAQLGEVGGDPLSLISSFLPIFGLLSKGGPVAFAASGTEIPGGSFIVKKSASDKNRELLEALGGIEVKGGIPGKDSVLAPTEGGYVMMMPGEMIIPPVFSTLAKEINERDEPILPNYYTKNEVYNKREVDPADMTLATEYGKMSGGVLKRADGGPLFRRTPEYMTDLMSTIREYAQVNPTFSSFNLPQSVIDSVRLQVEGGFSKETMDALIDEVRRLNGKVDGLSEEVRVMSGEVRGQRSDMREQTLQGSVDIDNGKIFFRKHLPGALDFEAERSS